MALVNMPGRLKCSGAAAGRASRFSRMAATRCRLPSRQASVLAAPSPTRAYSAISAGLPMTPKSRAAQFRCPIARASALRVRPGFTGSCANWQDSSSLFRAFQHCRDLDRWSGSPNAHVNLQHNQQNAEADKDSTDRAFDEYQDVPAGDQHGAAKVFLKARPEHEPKQDRCRMKAKPEQHITENADDDRLTDLEHVVVGGIDADADEEQRARIEILVRNRQQLHPDPDQRHVEQDEHDVANPKARDEAPENIRMLLDELRTGHDALDHQRAQQQRHHSIARNAKAHC